MSLGKAALSDATKIDFTGQAEKFQQFPSFNEKVISLLRSGASSKLLLVIDRGFGFKKEKAPHVVRDHLNLTGNNPLVGPNDSCGERFPSVNNIYITDVGQDMKRGVAAGVKPDIRPTQQDVEFIHSLGADFCCYNLVPTMIVAAHAGWKVIGIVVPEGADLKSILKAINNEDK